MHIQLAFLRKNYPQKTTQQKSPSSSGQHPLDTNQNLRCCMSDATCSHGNSVNGMVGQYPVLASFVSIFTPLGVSYRQIN